jgi:hypothetical protein
MVAILQMGRWYSLWISQITNLEREKILHSFIWLGPQSNGLSSRNLGSLTMRGGVDHPLPSRYPSNSCAQIYMLENTMDWISSEIAKQVQ